MLEATLDQASGLRRMLNTHRLGVLPMVGSPALVELLARALASQSRVAVLDEQGTQLLQAFHKTAPYELADLLSGEREFDAVAVRVNDKLSLVTAQTGLQHFLSYAQERQLSGESLFAGFLNLSKPFRWLLVQTLSLRSAVQLVGQEGEVLLAMVDTPEGIQQAYVQIKEAAQQVPDMQLRVVVQADDASQAQRVFRRLSDATQRFCRLEPQFGLALPFGWEINTTRAQHIRVAMSAWKTAEYTQEISRGI